MFYSSINFLHIYLEIKFTVKFSLLDYPREAHQRTTNFLKAVNGLICSCLCVVDSLVCTNFFENIATFFKVVALIKKQQKMLKLPINFNFLQLTTFIIKQISSKTTSFNDCGTSVMSMWLSYNFYGT